MDLSRLAANSKMRAGISPAVMDHACKTVASLVDQSAVINRLFLLDIAALRISQLARNCIERQIKGDWEGVKHIDIVLSLIYSAAVDAVSNNPGTVEEIHASVPDLIQPMLDIINQTAKANHGGPDPEIVPGNDDDTPK